MSGTAIIRRVCVLVVGGLVLGGCRRDVPVWPVELVRESFDADAMAHADRREYRRLAELCASEVCGSLEMTWWAVDSRLAGLRVVQLGGSPVQISIAKAGAPSGLDVHVHVKGRTFLRQRERHVVCHLGLDGAMSCP